MTCRICGDALTPENQYESFRLHYNKICKKCYCASVRQRWKTDAEYRTRKVKAFKKWRKANRKKYAIYIRDYRRRNILAVNGIQLRVHKRARPSCCELCDKPRHWLVYHHWDNQNPELGMWLCTRCHVIAEALEYPNNETAMKYARLKKTIQTKKAENGT